MQIEGWSTKYLTVLFRSIKGVKDKGRPRNSLRSEENQEKWQLEATWNPGWDPGMEKGQ